VQALLFEGPGKLALRTVPDPQAGPGQIVVRVEATTICGTDVRIVDGLKKRDVRLGHPIGHEFAGVVEEVGPDVRGFSVGDPVAVHPVVTCGACAFCRGGQENLCLERITLGYQVDGSFAEKILLPARAVARGNVFARPEHIRAEQACLLEPIAACLQGQQAMGLQAGGAVVIFGAGPIGLFHLMLAAERGCRPICVVEPRQARRRMALALGADEACGPDEFNPDDRFDGVILAVGRAELIPIALRAARPGGRISLFAGFGPDAAARIDPNAIHYKQLIVAGATESRRSDFAKAMELMASGRVRVDPIITHRFPLEEYAAAFETARSGAGLKVAMLP